MPLSALRKAKTIRSSPTMLDKAKNFFSGNPYEGNAKGKSGLGDVGPSKEVENEMIKKPYMHQKTMKTMFKKKK